MITLSLKKSSSPDVQNSASAAPALASSPIRIAAAASSVSSTAGPSAAASALPKLTKAELKAAAKGPSHGRKFGFSWLQIGRAKKRLQTLETVSLGEKRFIALVRVDDRQFLIGGAPSSVGLLTELAHEESFHQVLSEATQGLDVSLTANPAEPTKPNLSAEVLAPPADTVHELGSVMAPASIAANADAAAGSKDEAPAPEPVAFSNAFMQAYREVSAAETAGVLSDSTMPSHASGISHTSMPPVQSETSQPMAAFELPIAALEQTSVPEHSAILQAPAANEAEQFQAPALPQFPSAPSFTFQSWPPFASRQVEKPKPAPSLKPLLPVSGFTWSFTGAAS